MTKKLSKSLIFTVALLLLFAVCGLSLLSSTPDITSAYDVTYCGLEGNQGGSDIFATSNNEFDKNDSGRDIVATTDSSDFHAGTAGIWGGKDAKNLWYFGEKHFNLEYLKTIINGWGLANVSKDKPIVVAVIDTGLNINHEIFKDVLLKSADGKVLGYNAYNAVQNAPSDLGNITDSSKDFHGTAIASVIAMMIQELGLQDYIKIYPIKASYTGTDGESRFSIQAITKAINWANETMGASVINLSLGLLKKDMNATDWSTNKPLYSAVSKASQKGVLVAAAGNTSTDSATSKYYPASLDGVVSVMGHDAGSKKVGTSNFGNYDLIAPGNDIYVAQNVVDGKSVYKNMTGTSVAAPFVSMSAALLKLMFVQNTKYSSQAVVNMPTANAMARMLKNQGTSVEPSQVVIEHLKYKLKVLKIESLMSADYGNDIEQYTKPNGLDILDNGLLDNDDSCILRTDSTKVLELTANLTPIGETDPDIDGGIEWWVHQMDETQLVKSQMVGKGKDFVFPPIFGGAFTIEARVTIGERQFIDEVTVTVVYRAYVSGDVKVTLASQADFNVNDATSSIKMYTTEKVSLSLTGLKYVDRTKVVKWYVNDSYVSSGYTFDFAPKKAGDYKISAEYDGKMIAHDYNLFLSIKSFVLRPADLATIILVSLLAIGVVSTAIAMVQIKKKANKKESK